MARKNLTTELVEKCLLAHDPNCRFTGALVDIDVDCIMADMGIPADDPFALESLESRVRRYAASHDMIRIGDDGYVRFA